MKHGQLLYKNVVIDSHKPAVCFTEDQNHFLLYTSAAFCQNLPVKEAVKMLPTQVLPTNRVDKKPNVPGVATLGRPDWARVVLQ